MPHDIGARPATISQQHYQLDRLRSYPGRARSPSGPVSQTFIAHLAGLGSATMPWGTQRQVDRAVEVRSLSRFDVILRDYAPAGWTGGALVTFILQNSGPGTSARFCLRAN